MRNKIKNKKGKGFKAVGAWSLTLILSMISCGVQAQNVSLIAHPEMQIDQDTAIRLFLGQTKVLPSGKEAVLVDQKSSELSAAFHQKVLGKPDMEVRKYWARQLFTGGLTPPKTLEDDAAVIAFVTSNPNALGYISANKVSDKVKVIKSGS